MNGGVISVAMAAWRGERWIGAQLESLLAQSRVPDEIVICDDSPDDGTARAVAPFAARYAGIRYFRNPERLGICRNFEHAIRRTSGEFIFIADQDDLWDREKVARLHRELVSDPSCELVFCDSRVIDAESKELNYSAWEIQGVNRDELALLPGPALCEYLLIHPLGYAHDMAFRRRLSDAALPFPAEEACHDFWLSSIAAARGRLRIVPELLTSYRCHSGNFTVVDRPGRLARLRELRKHGKAELARTARLYAALAERLAGDRPPLVEELADYYRRRNDGNPLRIPLRDYRRFGCGGQTLLRDILFRFL